MSKGFSTSEKFLPERIIKNLERMLEKDSRLMNTEIEKAKESIKIKTSSGRIIRIPKVGNKIYEDDLYSAAGEIAKLNKGQKREEIYAEMTRKPEYSRAMNYFLILFSFLLLLLGLIRLRGLGFIGTGYAISAQTLNYDLGILILTLLLIGLLTYRIIEKQKEKD